MSKKSIYECDEQADVAIRTMVTAIVGGAVVPVHVNWALAASAMGAGVVAIGLIYDVQLTKEEGWKLVKQFFHLNVVEIVLWELTSPFLSMYRQNL